MAEVLLKQKTLKIADGLYLHSEPVETTVPARVSPVSQGTDIIVWVDCSGSMDRVLRLLGTHLKNKVVTMVNPNDTLTIGYFSGRGEYGFLLEKVTINGLPDLKPVHTAIDRYLQSMCLTGFKEPLEHTEKFIQGLNAGKTGRAVSFFFLTDGYDNQSGGDKGILDVCTRLSSMVNSATIVEYGWYCNKQLLAQMAAALGGSHIFAENFNSYEPVIEATVQKQVISGSKYDYMLDSDPLYGLVWAVDGEEVLQFAVDKDEIPPSAATVSINPQAVKQLYYFSSYEKFEANCYMGLSKNIDDNRPLYIGMGLLALKAKSAEVWNILKSLGDVEFIVKYNSCYGKQKLTEFVERCIDIGVDRDGIKGIPYKDGMSFNLVPADDAYCLVNLFNDLTAGRNYFYPDSDQFNYNRIGAKQVATNTILSDDEQEQVDILVAEIATEKDPQKLQALQTELLVLRTNKHAPAFTVDQIMRPYPLTKLVWNKSRANLSIQVTYQGSVSVPKNDLGVPDRLGSTITRNYTFIKDGILNVKQLPVSLDEPTFDKLKRKGLIASEATFMPVNFCVLNLEDLPTVNRKMVSDVSAADVFSKAVRHLALSADKKVFKYLEEQHFPKDQGAKLAALYGKEAAEWLISIGIKDSGFAPPSKPQKTGDQYPAVTLEFKIKGSTLPAVEAVLERYQSGKPLNMAQQMMYDSHLKYQAFLDSDIYQNASNQEELLRTWLITETQAAIEKTRHFNSEIAKVKFGIIVGQKWFKEFASYEENTLEVDSPYGKVSVTAERKDVMIDI